MASRDFRIGDLTLQLRPTRRDDLPTLFELQSDPKSNEMAGTKPRTREAFFASWERNFADPNINSRVIELAGGHGGEHGGELGGEPEIVGGVACFQVEGVNCIGYWIARARWGKGIASLALKMFLEEELRRPLHATAARSNTPSNRILEKNGFRCVGYKFGEETERYLASEIAEYVLE